MREIWTIGYENQTLSGVLATLKAEKIELLIDIREAPVSRKPGFSKKMLGASLEDAGIRYLHIRALGTPKAGRDAARRGDKATFHEIYARQFCSEAAQDAMKDVIGLAQDMRACLLCYEEDHHNCHRAIVADAMATEGFVITPLRVAPLFL